MAATEQQLRRGVAYGHISRHPDLFEAIEQGLLGEHGRVDDLRRTEDTVVAMADRRALRESRAQAQQAK